MKSYFLKGSRNPIALFAATAAVLALTACGGGSSSDSSSVVTVGEFTIQAKGGNGMSGSGGNADSSAIYADGYMNVEFLTSGTVDTAFTVPSYPHEDNLGTNGKIISVDTNITTVDSGNEPTTAGTLYLINGNTQYLCEAVNSGDTCDNNITNRVTGLKIDEGVTVVLGLNVDDDNSDADNDDSTGQDQARFKLYGDLIINGTLKTAALTTAGGTIDTRHSAPATVRDKGALYLYLPNDNSVIIGANGSVDTSGDNGSSGNERGGDGGYVRINVYYALVQVNGAIDASGGNGVGSGDGGNAAVEPGSGYGHVYISAYDGVFIHTGSQAINASGGNGAIGGNAGQLSLESETGFYNTAPILAIGGNGSAGNGGQGGYIYIESYVASIYNSADINTSGGDGSTNGGDAGDIDFYPGEGSYVGELLNSGNIYANGGDAGNGNAGNGSTVYLYLNGGGSTRTSGNIYANGGNAKSSGIIPANSGILLSVSGNGGDAGDVYVYLDGEGDDYGYGEEVASGVVQISGNIEVNGGDGDTNGGYGGNVEVETSYSDIDFPPVGKIQFLGYSSFDVSGGDGNISGGHAGNVEAYTEDAWTGDDYTAVPVGSIINEVQIIARGGYAENGTGGRGGYIEFEAEGEFYVGTTKVLNSGAIDISGGLGLDGGNSGGLYFYGHDAVENSGEIIALGGDAEGSTSTAGQGADDSIEMYSSYDILNSGAIIATGGNGTGLNAQGDDSGYLYVYAGGKVTNSGDLYFNGGASNGTADNSDGGYVDLLSEITYTTNTASVIDVSAGIGGSGTVGNVGDIYFDFVNVTPISGILN
ncbi:beta strand repeat-containing protein [Sulfurovum sp. ST-21]|uniref:Uncharacterized protein n=1 Tax=Sulfurovum indicum TaxID=2779528 RepID=A0A7M1S234_9BACT|nr:hypothetical protein [Sulfurovum indicum]QOR61284.1 hypothetical protein IMZ28_07450 [Sulfurovum indicum]